MLGGGFELMKIVEYKTLGGIGCDEIDRKVAEYISKGWEVYGNQVADSTGIGQVVVKYAYPEGIKTIEAYDLPLNMSYGWEIVGLTNENIPRITIAKYPPLKEYKKETVEEIAAPVKKKTLFNFLFGK